MTKGILIGGAAGAVAGSVTSGVGVFHGAAIGAIIGGASERELQLFTEYGEKVGLAFQIADDVLDATATSEQLGKTPGKDAASHKATYATIHGIDEARRRAGQLCQEAVNAARRTNLEPRVLEEIARFIIERQS